MGNLVFGSGAEPGRASKARGGLTESPMERDYDATESDRERYNGALRVGPEFGITECTTRDPSRHNGEPAILVPDTPEARVRQTEPLFGVVMETPAVSPIVSPDSAYISRPAEPDTTKVPNETSVYKTPAEVCQIEDRRQDTLRISPIVRHRNRTCRESELVDSDDGEEAENAFPRRRSRIARSSERRKVRYEPNRDEVCKKLHWTRTEYSRSSSSSSDTEIEALRPKPRVRNLVRQENRSRQRNPIVRPRPLRTEFTSELLSRSTL